MLKSAIEAQVTDTMSLEGVRSQMQIPVLALMPKLTRMDYFNGACQYTSSLSVDLILAGQL